MHPVGAVCVPVSHGSSWRHRMDPFLHSPSSAQHSLAHRHTQVDIFLNEWFSSVTQSCPTLCDLMDCSTPGFPVHHQLPELTQTHIHRVSDTIQPSHPLSSPSPPAFSLSGSFLMSQLFASGGQSIRVSASASVLPVSIQD